MNSLETLQEKIKECRACNLCNLMPLKPVSGFGGQDSKILLVGEAPGEDESIIERPFVGQAGMMLDKLLKEAGINRKKAYVCNVVNCRPTDTGKKNRPPTKQEINDCKHWLFKQIDLVKPSLIFTLGKVPTHVILNTKISIKLGDYLGKEYPSVINGHNCIVVPNYHPSYVMVYGKKEIQIAVDIFKKGLNYVNQ